MFKKMTEEAKTNLLETGISEFATCGFDKARMTSIAKKAGLSVGVIYKYYADKDAFFLACVRYSIELLKQVLEEIGGEDTDLIANMRLVLHALIRHSREHADYYILYHEITAGGCRQFAPMLAEEIESISASVYTRLLEQAKSSGRIRADIDCRSCAFFFDDLLMMMQFSYCCDYYRERKRIYCGTDSDDEERIVNELIKFMQGALGITEK